MTIDTKIATIISGRDQVRNATEETYPAVAAAVLAAAGPGFMAGIAELGYDENIPQAALDGCLTNVLVIAYTTRWLLEDDAPALIKLSL